MATNRACKFYTSRVIRTQTVRKRIEAKKGQSYNNWNEFVLFILFSVLYHHFVEFKYDLRRLCVYDQMVGLEEKKT